MMNENPPIDGDFFEFNDPSTLLETVLGVTLERCIEKWPESRVGAITFYEYQ